MDIPGIAEAAMDTRTWQVIIAMFALIGPAIAVVAVWLGRIVERTDAAHKRIDKLESTLSAELKEIRVTLKESLDQAWRHCPLVVERHREGDSKP